eukprot:SAG11_NODE_746_length_7383_cov_3.809995_4_plen_106_part_00
MCTALRVCTLLPQALHSSVFQSPMVTGGTRFVEVRMWDPMGLQTYFGISELRIIAEDAALQLTNISVGAWVSAGDVLDIHWVPTPGELANVDCLPPTRSGNHEHR